MCFFAPGFCICICPRVYLWHTCPCQQLSLVYPCLHCRRSCPYLYRSGAADIPENLLNWLMDPEYFLFKGCTCGRVSVGATV